jgi:hypothetical protein
MEAKQGAGIAIQGTYSPFHCNKLYFLAGNWRSLTPTNDLLHNIVKQTLIDGNFDI